MKSLKDFNAHHPLVIAALHLPPFQASGHPAAKPLDEIIEFAIRNTRYAVQAGIPALYLQDLGDHPWAPTVQPYTIAMLSVVGDHLRREFPDLFLGVCLMSHGGPEPLAIAQAISAQFVRLKTYIGAMVKAEGIVEGCAYQAISYRQQIQAESIAILADIYDRTGEPLGRLPLIEAATSAALFGRADGLILTGHSFSESLSMLREVRAAPLGVPLLLGGGATPENVRQALEVADGVIVSTTLKPAGDWSSAALASDWDPARCKAFMDALQ